MAVPHVRVPRSDFDELDSVWGCREPFDSRSARLDLRQLAAFKEATKTVAGVEIQVGVGDLLVSERWLEARWGWSRGRVRRFLKKLEADNWLRTIRVQPQYHLTICDVAAYVDLQTHTDETRADTGPRSKKKEGVTLSPTEKDKTNTRARRRVPKDWKPTSEEEQALRLQAVAEGVDYDREFAAMCDWEFRNARSDWTACLRGWIRKAGEHHGTRNGNGRANGYYGGPRKDWRERLPGESADDDPVNRDWDAGETAGAGGGG